jgi:hypothetical protein
MVIKPFTINSYRVLFITEIGIKIFDMEFNKNGDFRLHYCLDALNRKLVIKILKNDIGLMLDSIPKTNIRTLQNRENGRTIIRAKDNTGVKYYFLGYKTNRVDKIIQTRGLFKKMEMQFYSNNGYELDSVKISHNNINLSINLSILNENNREVPK